MSADKQFDLESRLIYVCADALITWGELEQMRQTTEECAELIKELCKFTRYKSQGRDEEAERYRVGALEELADVYLMVRQMRLALDVNGTFETLVQRRVVALEKMIDKGG